MHTVTTREVLQHMTGHVHGHPRQIGWGDFTEVAQSRDGHSDAFTHADFGPRFSFSSRPDRDGIHRLTRVRVTVAMNRAQSWVVRGRQAPLLLRHEQGHYSLTFLVARELCRDLLQLEWDAAVLEAVGRSRPRQITSQLRSDGERLARDADAESGRLNHLYDDPVNGVKNPDGSIDPPRQAQWDRLMAYAITYDTAPGLLLQMGGGSARNW